MGDLFEEYQRHITRLLDVISDQLKACELSALGNTATHRQNLENLKKTIASADETARQLELEARASDPSLSSSRMDDIRRIMSILKNAATRSKALTNEMERSDLFGGGEHYTALQDSDKLLQKGTEYLQASYAMAQETEEIGYGAAEELYGQRNKIYNVQHGIGEMKFSLKDADEYLTKLLKQGRLNRVILRVVIGAIMATAAIIIVSRVLRHFI